MQAIKILVSRGRDFPSICLGLVLLGLASPSSIEALVIELGLLVAAAFALILVGLILVWPLMGGEMASPMSLKNLASGSGSLLNGYMFLSSWKNQLVASFLGQ